MALASGGDPSTPTSQGGWISTAASGQTSPSYLTLIDSSDHADSRPVTALNNSGEGVTAWRDNITGSVMVSQIAPGHVWSTPQALASGSQPTAAIDAAGDVTVAWVNTHGGIAYAYSAAGSGSFVAGQVAGGSDPGDTGPQLVMDAGGNAWVVWSGGRPSEDSADRSVRAAYLSASALTAGAAPGWSGQLASSAGPDYSVSLSTNPSGSAVIAAFAAGDSPRIGIAYAQSGSGSFATPTYTVPNPGPGAMEDPSVALNDAGEAVLAWTECTSRFDPFCDLGASTELATATAGQLANPAGVAFTAPQTVPLGNTGAQYHPRVALNGDEVALAWDDLTQSGRQSSFSVDGAAEPLTDLNAGTAAWQQLLSGQSASSTATADVNPRIAIDANSDVTLAWQTSGAQGDSTVHATTVSACAATCGASSPVTLDSQAGAAGRLSLVAAPDGDVLLSWTSYAPSGGALPTVVAATYDPGPTLSDIQIPATATAGTAATFSVQASDHWTALEGPVVTHWDFGDGTTATGSSVSHTYTAAGSYTVTVTAATAAAQTTVTAAAHSTLTQQVVVSPAAVITHVAPKVTTPLTGVAAWGSRTGVRSVSADMTVPALSCAGNSRAHVGQELGLRLWGSRLTATTARVLADFAGVSVECKYASAIYRPSFTVANVRGNTSSSRKAKLNVTPGDLLQLSITDSSAHATLSITDLSTPTQAPAVITGPSLAPDAGWQVGAFPTPGLRGPYATVPTSFTNVTAGGTGIGSLTGLERSRWNGASVTKIGHTNNQMSVVYASVPKAPRGGSIAAPAQGKVSYRRPGSHHWTRLTHNTGLPADTVIDASNGTVQLSNPEPQDQHQSVTAWGGQFSTSSNSQGNTSIDVTGVWTGGANGNSARASAAAAHKKHNKTVHGNLWAKGHGKFTTKGSYGAAAVLGTKWLTRNLKNGTLFKVAKNRYDHNDRIRVTVDYPHRHTVVLSQGQSVLAPAPKIKPKVIKPAPFAFTLVGVKRVNGRYNVNDPGYYQVTLLSETKPYYVDAAVAPNQPGGGGAWFYRDGSANGEPRWEIHFALQQGLATFQLWNVGIRIGGKLYVVPLRLRG